MTIEEIRNKVQEIYMVSADDEAAHGHEDDLYHEFVKHIAETGNKKQREMATEILKTKDIKFARWCA